MQRASSVSEFLASLDDELFTLPYLSMSVSVSNHRLEALAEPPSSPVMRRQPDADFRPLSTRPSALDLDASKLCADSGRSSRSVGGLRVSYPHSLHSLAASDASVTVDYALARERGITFTIAPATVRVRKRTLLWLFLTQLSMVVGFVSQATSSGLWPSLSLGRAVPHRAARALIGAPPPLTAGISMIASFHGSGLLGRRSFATGGSLSSPSARTGAGPATSSAGASATSAGFQSSASSSSSSSSSSFSATPVPSAHPRVSAARSALGALGVSFADAREAVFNLELPSFALPELPPDSFGSSARRSLETTRQNLHATRSRVSRDLEHLAADLGKVKATCAEYLEVQVELLDGVRGAFAAVPEATAAHWWAPGMPPPAELGARAVRALEAGPPAELGAHAAREGISAHAHAPPAQALAADLVGFGLGAGASTVDFPRGFEHTLAIQFASLCGMSYHCALDADAPSPGTAADTARISAELEEEGLSLVETFRDRELDTFAFLARQKAPAESGGAKLFLVFRGSVSALNKELNFDFFRCGYDAAEACFERAPTADGAETDSAAAGGAAAGAGAGADEILVHRGFLRAWQSLRKPVLAAVRRVGEAEARAGREFELYVTGHSLGGAMAMLASVEIAHFAKRFAPPRQPAAAAGAAAGASGVGATTTTAHHGLGGLFGKRPAAPRPAERPAAAAAARMGGLVAHKLYTFATPRIGNTAFASHFAKAFCSNSTSSSYWAVQSGGDAVPHLPLQAMGFHHPPGRIVTINKYGRTGVHLDTGDDRLHAWVPRGLDPVNWVRTHDIVSYTSELRGLQQPLEHDEHDNHRVGFHTLAGPHGRLH
jgi:hypothetical protein